MILKLNEVGTEQPFWWTNFVSYVYFVHIKNRSDISDASTILHTELGYYGAKLRFRELVFDNDEYATLFLLRFSS